MKKSSQAATVTYSTLFLNEQDNRLVHHLKGLIRAANEFHTSASTTASTVVGGGGTQPPPTDFGDDDARSNVASQMPSMKRKRIETFLSQNEQIARAGTFASDRKRDEIVSPGPLTKAEIVFEAREVDSSQSFSTIFTSGFSKIAQRALQQLDLQRADDLLRQALKWYRSSGSDDMQHQRHLQTQLALCNLLQGNRREAQDLILDLVDSRMEQDTVAHQLLYALALLQLHELDFEGAQENSKRLWEALRRTPHCAVLEANDAMRLLATSYKELGDSLLADAIEAELPDLRLSDPVPRMVDYLVSCEELLVGIFGLQGCSVVSNSFALVRQIRKLPISQKPSSLQMREQKMVEIHSSTSKSPPNNADNDLLARVFADFDKNQPKAKKRSWSNLRAFFRPRLSRDSSAIDLYPLHTGAQNSTFKLIKRVKTSHVEQMSCHEAVADGNTSGIQNPTIPNWNPSVTTGSDVQNDHDSESNSPTMERIIGQPDNSPAVTTETCQEIHEPQQGLQRKFSFQAGVLDNVSREPAATPLATCYEMPNNAIFELMDTSPHVQPLARAHKSDNPNQQLSSIEKRKKSIKIYRLKRLESNSRPPPCHDSMTITPATSLEMENDIYHLLGFDERPTDAAVQRSSANLDSEPSSAFSDPLCHLDGDIGCSSSGSDSDTSSDFDQVTQSTRQTSFNSSDFSVEEMGYESDISEHYPLQSDLRMKTQRPTEFKPSDGPLTQTPFTAMSNDESLTRLSQSPSPLQTRTSTCETTSDTAQARSLKSGTRSRREFGPAIARLYRYRSPRKPAFRRRLPGGAATGLSKLFHAQSDEDKFDFGFNKALYFGPDAVIGPFTDLEETDLSEGAYTVEPALHGIPTFLGGPSDDALLPAKLDSRSVESKEGGMDGLPAYDEGPSRNRQSSWTRTQVDEFFEISHERHPLETYFASSASLVPPV